jgi:hypothetical protein
MPLTMKIWLSEASAPRVRAGASSLRYIGTVAELSPTPRPMTPRVAIIVGQPPASAQPTDPAITTTAAAMIVVRRPIRRPSHRAPSAPIIAPADRLAVITPFCSAVRCHCLVMMTSTPAITPRS